VLSVQGRDPHAWCFLSGRICALENNLLRRDFFEHLLPLEEPKEILACLKESPLREYFLTPEDVLDFEEILQHRFFSLLQEVKWLSPEPGVWELLQTRYDQINLKNYLKERLFGLRRPTPFPSPYGDETWATLWEGGEVLLDAEFGIRSAELQNTPSSPQSYSPSGAPVLLPYMLWQMGIKRLKAHLEEISKNPSLLDLILDGSYLSCVPRLAETTASPFIVNYYLEYQRLVGILFLWRASTKGLLGYVPEQIGRGEVTPPHLPGYEKTAEDTLMERLEVARFFVFGPERVFGYLKGLETETLNLRLAIGGRLQGLPPEQIITRLRKGYV
jgi:hypothetical protein